MKLEGRYLLLSMALSVIIADSTGVRSNRFVHDENIIAKISVFTVIVKVREVRCGSVRLLMSIRSLMYAKDAFSIHTRMGFCS